VATRNDRQAAWPDFLDLWEALCRESVDRRTIVVVEGERDRAALRALGLPGAVVLVHRGRSLSRRAEELGKPGTTLIVLTDWDVEGGHLAQRLRLLLSPGPARVDLEFRRRFALILHGEVAHVEGLAGWARRTAEKAGAPLDHFLGPVLRTVPAPTE
jgi:5S rRNA maturation endonuclease (ribonuclease M5)